MIFTVSNCYACNAEINAETSRALDTRFWHEESDRQHNWVHRLEDIIADLRAENERLQRRVQQLEDTYEPPETRPC